MKKNLIAICVLFILTIFFWHKIYYHSILGEGYIYFQDGFEEEPFHHYNGIENIFRYDLFARNLYKVSEVVFVDNTQPLMIFSIVYLGLLSVVYYFMVLKITNNRVIAFIASIFVSTNFFTTADMVGVGYYQWFSQRVPGFLFSFIALMFYVDFIKKRAYKYYFLTFGFYMLSIFSAHNSIYFLPAIVFYGTTMTVFDKKLKEKIITRLLEFIPFVLFSYFITMTKPAVPAHGTIPGALQSPTLINDMLYQVTLVGIPFNIWQMLPLGGIPVMTALPYLYFPFVIFVPVLLYMLYKQDNKAGKIIIFLLLSFLASCFLNLVIHREEVILYVFDTDHYFYPLGFYISFIWAIVLYYLWKQKIIFKVFIVLFLFSWVYQNMDAYAKFDDRYKYNHLVNNDIKAYVKKLSPKLTAKTLVIMPKQVGPHAGRFFKKFYGHKKTEFVSFVVLTQKQVDYFNPKRDYILGYDFDKNMVTIDTKNYVSIFKTAGFLKKNL